MHASHPAVFTLCLTFCLATFVTPSADAAVGRTVADASVSATGEASYSIPIFTPPGTKGATPQVALVYGHRQDEGLAGVGWSIAGLSVISRCSKTFAQDGAPDAIKLTLADRFCLDGIQLKLATGTYGTMGSTYRTELDTAARIRAYGTAGNGPMYFGIEQKNGLIYEYGNSNDSRIESLAAGFTTTARAWALSKISDREGNTIQFTYTEDGAPYGAYRISTIRYTSNTSQGLTAPYKVTFVYQPQPLEDVDTGFGAGGLIKDLHRIDRIDVEYTPPGGGTTLVRRYQLTYEGTVSSTGRSRLASVQECAGSPLDCLSATNFTYVNGTNGLTAEVSTGTTIPAGTSVLPLDINGDGRSDMVYPSSSGTGTWMYRLANSSGGYNAALNSNIPNTGFAAAIAFDWNADGLEDMLVPYSGGTWWVIQGSLTGLVNPINTGAPINSLLTPAGNAIALDMNGDGLDDLVWAESNFNITNPTSMVKVRYRQWGGTWGLTATVYDPCPPLQACQSQLVFPVFAGAFPQTRRRNFDANGDGFRDVAVQVKTKFLSAFTYSSRVVLGGVGGGYSAGSTGTVASQGRPIDVNGDGYTDIAMHLGTGFVSFQLSTGQGFGPTNSGTSLANLDFGRSLTVDWDSDGYEDLLLPNTSTGTWHYIRSTGETLATAVNSGLTTSNPQAVHLVDVNGDGLEDVAYVNSSGVYAYRLRAGVKADLLASATDGFNNVSAFSYVPITQAAYTKYANASYPSQDYVGPIYVVQTQSSSTGIASTYTLTYSYAGLQLNLQGRALTGFDTRTAIDSRNGLRVVDYLRRDFPYIGKLAQRDFTQSNGTLIQRVANNWATVAGGTGFQQFHLPYILTSTETNYEVGGTYNNAQINQIVTSMSVDQYGTPFNVTTTTTEPSSANGMQAGASYVERFLLSSLNNNTTTWCLGRPGQTDNIKSHNQDSGAQVTRTTTQTWDTLYCRPTQEVVEPGSSQWRVTRDIGYDGFGNINSQTITGVGMTPRTSSANWGTTGQFPISVTNALGQVTQRTFDYALGTQKTETDPNNVTVTWTYDAFGRRTRETRPDGTATAWSITACAAPSYCGDAMLRYYVQADLRDTTNVTLRNDRQFFDSFDRLKYDEPQLFNGDLGYAITHYDALGRISQQSAPTFSSIPQIFWTTFQYDLLNRVKEVKRPLSDSNPTLQVTTVFYEGLTTRVVDPLSKQSRQVANVLGNLVSTSDHDGHSKSFDYDAFGNRTRVADSLATLQSATFNVRGMRLTSSDADLGNWSYVFNALGELTSHTDANLKVSTFTYDPLSRPLTRVFPEGAGSITSTWTWGASATAKNIGKLERQEISGTNITTYRETYTYDSLGRPSQTQYTEGANSYLVNTEYDTVTGFVDTLTYPTSTASYRLKLKYTYQYGHLQKISHFNDPTRTFWQANATDARGQVIDEQVGISTTLPAGIATISGYDQVTGLIDSRTSTSAAGGGMTLQNLSYTWDAVGNLAQRQDGTQSLTEQFAYDNLHRLMSSTRNGSTNLTVGYNARGNITSKSGVGTYTYHATKVHAVSSVNTGSATWNFTYDANGNMTSRNGTEILWYASNLPKRIRKTPTSTTDSSEFEYAPHGARWRHLYRKGTTLYTHVYIGNLVEKVVEGANTEWKHYIYAAGAPVAIYERHSSGASANSYYYVLQDHLGSTDVIANPNGGVFVRESFDAFGKRRGTNWTGAPTQAQIDNMNTSTRRGFTFHEHLDSTDLIHMNGRVYDPTIGRFVSADPFIPDAGMTQAYNRYSYVYNNPLAFTDPSGFLPGLVPEIPIPGCGPLGFICSSIIGGLLDSIFGSSSKKKSGCFGPPVGCFGQEGLPRTPGFNPAAGTRLPSSINAVGPQDSCPTPGSPGINPEAASPCGFESPAMWRVIYIDFLEGIAYRVTAQYSCARGVGCEWVVADVTDYCRVPLENQSEMCHGGVVGDQPELVAASVVGVVGAARLAAATLVVRTIRITDRGLAHVIARHTIGGARTAGRSVFNANEDAAALVRNASRYPRVQQPGGNFERVVDAGRTIGVDRATGQPTSIYTVITNEADDLITAFPGRP